MPIRDVRAPMLEGGIYSARRVDLPDLDSTREEIPVTRVPNVLLVPSSVKLYQLFSRNLRGNEMGAPAILLKADRERAVTKDERESIRYEGHDSYERRSSLLSRPPPR